MLWEVLGRERRGEGDGWAGEGGKGLVVLGEGVGVESLRRAWIVSICGVLLVAWILQKEGNA